MGHLHWIRFLVVAGFRNLWRSPRRTFISLSALAAAVAALILFRSFVDGVKRTFKDNLIKGGVGHYQISGKGFRDNKGDDPFAYPVTNVEEIEAAINKEVGSLVFLGRRQEFTGLLNAGDRSLGAKGFGIDAEREKKYHALHKLESGRHLADGPRSGVFMGWRLAKLLSTNVGEVVTLLVSTASGSLNATDLEVVGTFKTGVNEIDEAVFYINNDVALSLLRLEGASTVTIAFGAANELQYRPGLEKLFSERFPELEFVHWRYLYGEFFDNSIAWLNRMFNFLGVIILVIAALSIVNIFMVNLFERIGEFGTLRAIGTQRSEVASLIFLESVVQSVMGALMGVVLAGGLIVFALQRGITMPPPPNMTTDFHVYFTMPWTGLLSIVCLCVVIAGVVAAILPALKMARINVVEALGRNV